jgi:hypothetical protein
MCAEASELKEVRKDLERYVAFKHVIRNSSFDFAQALIEHREQCLLNLLDEEDVAWRRRVEILEAIARAEGISLEGTESLQDALDVIAERETERRRDGARQ